jgi:hypothetical protein
MFLATAIFLGIITSNPIIISANESIECTNCGIGGTIAPPINNGQTTPYVINGNALRNAINAALDFNILSLIDGTYINADDVRGIKAIVWAPQANTRQLYIEINGVSSPMFATDTTDPARIFMPREAMHEIEWIFNAAQLAALTSNAFNARIRAGNAIWGIGPIALLGENGEILCTTTYSTQNLNGTWSPFVPVCRCVPCKGCNAMLAQGGTVAQPSRDETLVWDDRTPPAHITNGNAHRISGVYGTAQAVLDIDVLELIAGTGINADDIHGVEATIYNIEGTRQVYIYVNDVMSPVFETVNLFPDSPTPYQTLRTRENVLTYMNPQGGAFVPANADRFDVRIRANNQRFAVTEFALLDENGDVLGSVVFTPYSSIEEGAHEFLLAGEWGKFTVACECGGYGDLPCYDCGEVTCICTSCLRGGRFVGTSLIGDGWSMDIDVLDLINGTVIKPSDIYGIEIVTWEPNSVNRQVYIDVNGVVSPMFHGASSPNADRIWAIMSHGDTPDNGGRTPENRLTYMNQYGGTPKVASIPAPLTPFVDNDEHTQFDVRIRANNDAYQSVLLFALLGGYGEILGSMGYSNRYGWFAFVSNVRCWACDYCAEQFEMPPYYNITADAVYDSASGDVTVTWTPSEVAGTFEVFYSVYGDDDNEQSLGVFENQLSYIHETDGSDFIAHYYKVVQMVDDETVIESNVCNVIWSPVGHDWTEYLREWELDVDDEIFADINTDDNAFVMSATIEAAGVPDLHLRIGESGLSYTMQNDMWLGVIPELIYPDNLAVESVTLRFEIGDEHLDNVLGVYSDSPEFDGINRLNVFMWCDEVNMSLPVETFVDEANNALYTEVDRLGTFAIMDMEMWFDFLSEHGDDSDDVGIAPMSAGIMATSSAPSFITIQGVQYSTSLTSLTLYDMNLTNIDIEPLMYMTNLQILNIRNSQVSDLTPMSGLTNLHTLRVHSSRISNLSPISGLTNLQSLWLNGNQINDITPLSGLTKLGRLGLVNNQISDISPLSGLTNLGILHLPSNQIHNLSPLSGLINLWELDLSYNQVNNLVPLYGLTLDIIYLQNNPIILSQVDALKAALPWWCIVYHNAKSSTLPGFNVNCSNCNVFLLKCQCCGVCTNCGDCECRAHTLACLCCGECAECGDCGCSTHYWCGDCVRCYICSECICNLPTTFDVLIGLDWTAVRLDAPPNPWNNVYSDDDGLSDWEEINTDLITWDSDGRLVLPTILEVMGGNFEFIIRYPQAIREEIENIRVLPCLSNPVKADTDGDGLDDCAELYIGTKPFDSDTDKDDLSDGLEVELWFDPLDFNSDGDSYDDYKEYMNGTNPFARDLTHLQNYLHYKMGLLGGDWIQDDSIPILLGQVVSSFIPYGADVRDLFANIFINCDTESAYINTAGLLLEFVPYGAGIATDSTKAATKVGRFIARNINNAPMILDGVATVVRILPDHLIADVAKLLPASSFDNIVDALKQTDIDKSTFDRLRALYDGAGRNFDEVLENTRFRSFSSLKNALGDPGAGRQWHHLVEQCQGFLDRSNFDVGRINSVRNVVSLDVDTHKLVSAFYSSVPIDQVQFNTGGRRFRDWLNGQSFEAQYEWGLRVLREHGVQV